MSIWDFYQKTYEKLWVQRVSLEPTRSAVMKAIKYTPTSILDIGCGTGQLLISLQTLFPNAQCTGIEPSQMFETAKEKGLNVIKATFEEFESNQCYDLIVCTHAFPYFLNKPSALHKMNQLLSNHGQLIIAHAETNTLYDVLALSLVKITTSKAYYPPSDKMQSWLENQFDAIRRVRVNGKCVPSIGLYEASKRPL